MKTSTVAFSISHEYKEKLIEQLQRNVKDIDETIINIINNPDESNEHGIFFIRWLKWHTNANKTSAYIESFCEEYPEETRLIVLDDDSDDYYETGEYYKVRVMYPRVIINIEDPEE